MHRGESELFVIQMVSQIVQGRTVLEWIFSFCLNMAIKKKIGYFELQMFQYAKDYTCTVLL